MNELIEIVGAIIMLVYLWLEYKGSIWLWPVGVLVPVLYIYIYFVNKFYADMGINVYYLLASIYGWFRWKNDEFTEKTQNGENSESTEKISVKFTPNRYWGRLLAVFALLFAVIFWVLSRYTDSPVPCGDAFTTALSVVAMWMLAQKYIEQWWLWLVVNIVSAALYFWKGMVPTGITYIVYSIVPIFGYWKWRKMM